MKKNKKAIKVILITLIVVNIIVITFSLIKTDYDVIVPATINPIEKVYDVDNDTTYTPNIYTVSVMEYYNISLYDYLIAKLNKNAILSVHDDDQNTDTSYIIASGTVQKELSLSNAIIAAYTKASENDSSITCDYEFKGFKIYMLYGNKEFNLQPGDIITHCEGKELSENYFFANAFMDTYGTTELSLDQTYHFTVIRDGEILELEEKAVEYTYSDGTKKNIIGLSSEIYYEIVDDSLNPSCSITMPSSYGPSGGLMQSLYLYDILTGENLTDGLKICGTGTVTIEGYAGEIGGIQAKIVAASVNNVDVFFCPVDNYEEALEKYNTLNTDMQLVKVESLSDCIDFLRSYQNER